MSEVANKDLCAELYELSGWANNAGTKPEDRLKLWQQRYSTWEMGEGNPAYEITPLDERRGVHIGEWHVVEDDRYMMVVASLSHNPSHWYDREVQRIKDASIPAYDLGYLLRKLPKDIESYTIGIVWDNRTDSWRGEYGDDELHVVHADTPENAACLLAIELFKQGILTKESN